MAKMARLDGVYQRRYTSYLPRHDATTPDGVSTSKEHQRPTTGSSFLISYIPFSLVLVLRDRSQLGLQYSGRTLF
jgi:hypothetical protein